MRGLARTVPIRQDRRDGPTRPPAPRQESPPVRPDPRLSPTLPLRVALIWLFAGIPASADVPARREPVGPYLGGALPARPPAPSGDWVAVKAFPRLAFEDPVGLVAGPGT